MNDYVVFFKQCPKIFWILTVPFIFAVPMFIGFCNLTYVVLWAVVALSSLLCSLFLAIKYDTSREHRQQNTQTRKVITEKYVIIH